MGSQKMPSNVPADTQAQAKDATTKSLEGYSALQRYLNDKEVDYRNLAITPNPSEHRNAREKHFSKIEKTVVSTRI